MNPPCRRETSLQVVPTRGSQSRPLEILRLGNEENGRGRGNMPAPSCSKVVAALSRSLVFFENWLVSTAKSVVPNSRFADVFWRRFTGGFAASNRSNSRVAWTRRSSHMPDMKLFFLSFDPLCPWACFLNLLTVVTRSKQ